MVQLELDPRYLHPERFSEIDFNRSRILRIAGKSQHWMEKGDFEVISLDYALLTLLEGAYSYFNRFTTAKSFELDMMVGKVLIKSLPFIQGEQGKFNSFRHFTHSLFRRTLSHISQDRYRHLHRGHVEVKASTKSHSSEGITRGIVGFQPSLFRLESNKKDGTYVLPDYISVLPAYELKAIRLKADQPGIRSSDIANVLAGDGEGEFSPDTIRVWFKRVRDQIKLGQAS